MVSLPAGEIMYEYHLPCTLRATVLVVHRYHRIDALLLVLYGPGTITLILQLRKPYLGEVM